MIKILGHRPRAREFELPYGGQTGHTGQIWG
jgi:hypothetical protein